MENNKSLGSMGRTGILITPIGIGCWQFSEQNNMAGKFWTTLEDNLIEKIVSLLLLLFWHTDSFLTCSLK